MLTVPSTVASPSLAPLVQTLTAEHGRISELAESIQAAGSAGARKAALDLAALFETHAATETDELLAALAPDPSVNLEAILAGVGPSKSEEVELDVRELPHASRHTAIFNIVDHLQTGQALIITSDHDPEPLHAQLEAAHPGAFGWTYEVEGPEEWRVAIRRM